NVTSSGTLEARDGGTLRIDDLVESTGTISARDGGTVWLSGNWTNEEGTFEVDNGRLDLDGTFSTASLEDLSRDDGEIRIRGTLDHSGATFEIDEAFGFVQMEQGRVSGGTLILSAPDMLRFSNNANNQLYGVTLGSDLTIAQDSGKVAVDGAFSLDG